MTDLTKAAQAALENLEAVLCDPEGRACIHGSDGDLKIIDEALDSLRAALTAQPAQSVALPDLPTHWTKVTDPDGVEVKVWRAFQMRDFARAAIAAAQPQQATDKIGGAA